MELASLAPRSVQGEGITRQSHLVVIPWFKLCKRVKVRVRVTVKVMVIVMVQVRAYNKEIIGL